MSKERTGDLIALALVVTLLWFIWSETGPATTAAFALAMTANVGAYVEGRKTKEHARAALTRAIDLCGQVRDWIDANYPNPNKDIDDDPDHLRN